MTMCKIMPENTPDAVLKATHTLAIKTLLQAQFSEAYGGLVFKYKWWSSFSGTHGGLVFQVHMVADCKKPTSHHRFPQPVQKIQVLDDITDESLKVMDANTDDKVKVIDDSTEGNKQLSVKTKGENTVWLQWEKQLIK